jgi:ABC-type sugar transport system permease subunit
VSFFDWNMLQPARFVGIGNYAQFFFGDQLTGKVVGNSVYYALGALPASVLIPLGRAVLLNLKLKPRAFSDRSISCRWLPRWWQPQPLSSGSTPKTSAPSTS